MSIFSFLKMKKKPHILFRKYVCCWCGYGHQPLGVIRVSYRIISENHQVLLKQEGELDLSSAPWHSCFCPIHFNSSLIFAKLSGRIQRSFLGILTYVLLLSIVFAFQILSQIIEMFILHLESKSKKRSYISGMGRSMKPLNYSCFWQNLQLHSVLYLRVRSLGIMLSCRSLKMQFISEMSSFQSLYLWVTYGTT